MATAITCVVRDGSGPGGPVDAVGGAGWTRDADTLIGEIAEGREYFVEVDLARVTVIIAERNGRRYLRTDPDESAENNLIALPNCS